MDAQTKKTALRMIPYGLYVLTAESPSGAVAASTVNWVTQASFDPPLVAVGVKKDSGAHAIAKEAGAFALNVLGKGQQGLAFKFFKSLAREGDSIGGEKFARGSSGAPLLASTLAAIECKLVQTVERGDHSLFIGEVVDVRLNSAPAGRADDATLVLKDLGESTFYGG
jgi:flavin reductase (DIM6/NTAB) family NADH-FMN oxidoreductase RutF